MQILGIDPLRDDVPKRAVHVLLDGGLVAFPTDTYYALGASVWNPEAVERVFAAKRRPPGDPLPVLAADVGQWETVVAEVPGIARKLAERFWPGALTIVCRRAPHLPPVVTGGGDTVGVRVPGSPLARALCRALGMPVTGTSANTHGMPSPVTAAQVALDLGDAVDLILDGGRCPIARPSTVLDVTRDPPVVVRPGAVPLEALQEVLGEVALRR